MGNPKDKGKITLQHVGFQRYWSYISILNIYQSDISSKVR